MHSNTFRIVGLLAGVLLVAGCVTAPVRQELNAGFDKAWPALNEVMSSRTQIEVASADHGRIVGSTRPRRAERAAPGVTGSLFGVKAEQEIRHHVVARLYCSPGVCAVTVSAWMQRLQPPAADALNDLSHDPADLGADLPSSTRREMATWVDVARDTALETAIADAVKARLK